MYIIVSEMRNEVGLSILLIEISKQTGKDDQRASFVMVSWEFRTQVNDLNNLCMRRQSDVTLQK